MLASKIQARLDDIRRNIDRAADGTEVDPGGVHQTRAALLSSQAHEATKELAMLENTLMDLEVEMREMSAWFESRQGAKEFNIDDDTKPSDALSMQVLRLVALDSAIEDAYFVLRTALDQGAVDIDTSMRCTRKLAREQFEVRATMQKIQRIGGPRS